MSVDAAMKARIVTSILMLVCMGWLGIAAANDAPTPAQEKLQFMEKSMPNDAEGRFYKLGDLAEAAYDAGEMDKAQTYANELLSTARNYSSNWNYGNAVFLGNTVNGLVALKRDHDVSGADDYLIASAAHNDGSPQLDSFGPSMRLAKVLLAAGERDRVLDFLGECRSFWKMGQAQLDGWTEAIENGQYPDFAPNIRY